jgi:hypothetical protein
VKYNEEVVGGTERTEAVFACRGVGMNVVPRESSDHTRTISVKSQNGRLYNSVSLPPAARGSSGICHFSFLSIRLE